MDNSLQQSTAQVGEYGVKGFGANHPTDIEQGSGPQDNKAPDAVQYKTMSDIDMHQLRDNNRALRCIFDMVNRDGRFNHRGARIPLPSGMNIKRWRTMLRGY